MVANLDDAATIKLEARLTVEMRMMKEFLKEETADMKTELCENVCRTQEGGATIGME